MISTRMTTEREHSHHDLDQEPVVPELKREEQSRRLPYLADLDSVPLCPLCVATRIVLYSLALYGAYSLLS